MTPIEAIPLGLQIGILASALALVAGWGAFLGLDGDTLTKKRLGALLCVLCVAGGAVLLLSDWTY